MNLFGFYRRLLRFRNRGQGDGRLSKRQARASLTKQAIKAFGKVRTRLRFTPHDDGRVSRSKLKGTKGTSRNRRESRYRCRLIRSIRDRSRTQRDGGRARGTLEDVGVKGITQGTNSLVYTSPRRASNTETEYRRRNMRRANDAIWVPSNGAPVSSWGHKAAWRRARLVFELRAAHRGSQIQAERPGFSQGTRRGYFGRLGHRESDLLRSSEGCQGIKGAIDIIGLVPDYGLDLGMRGAHESAQLARACTLPAVAGPRDVGEVVTMPELHRNRRSQRGGTSPRIRAVLRELVVLRQRSYHLPPTIDSDCPQSLVCDLPYVLTTFDPVALIAAVYSHPRRFRDVGHQMRSRVQSRFHNAFARLKGVAHMLVTKFHVARVTAQDAYNHLYGNTTVPELRDKMVPQNKRLAHMLEKLDGNDPWLSHPHLGAKLTKVQALVGIVNGRVTDKEPPIVPREIRDRLAKVIGQSLKLKEDRETLMDVDTEVKAPAPPPTEAPRGTKRPSTSTNETPAKATRHAASSSRDDWRVRAEFLTSEEVMRKVRELVAQDGKSDGPEAKLLYALMALRSTMFAYETQVATLKRLWNGVADEADKKMDELRALVVTRPVAPVVPQKTSDSSTHTSKRSREPVATASTVDNPARSSRVTTTTPPAKPVRTRAAAKAEETKTEEVVASSSRDKGKQRAAPKSSERPAKPQPEAPEVKFDWHEDVEADRKRRMVVSEGEEQVDYSDGEVEGEGESDLSDVPDGYHKYPSLVVRIPVLFLDFACVVLSSPSCQP
ncbi:hypothetical protein DFP72DRAFT_853203 [Ephemerocybe angulata]|uniref:Uncharacterized protein n=1 Tax=Ephemerocybe angulata TaxID=980116 RepID=A0A8H6M0I7_9AGAR|nr:hypothetical protein DFP72DRAFT_853203 [Tulosesus angulatus]